MLDLKGSNLEFEGIIWSVVILSSTLINTFPLISSPNSLLIGNGFILGPLTISTSTPSFAGLIIIESSIINLLGISISKSIIFSLGSVRTPFMADTAAVSGLTR